MSFVDPNLSHINSDGIDEVAIARMVVRWRIYQDSVRLGRAVADYFSSIGKYINVNEVFIWDCEKEIKEDDVKEDETKNKDDIKEDETKDKDNIKEDEKKNVKYEIIWFKCRIESQNNVLTEKVHKLHPQPGFFSKGLKFDNFVHINKNGVCTMRYTT